MVDVLLPAARRERRADEPAATSAACPAPPSSLTAPAGAARLGKHLSRWQEQVWWWRGGEGIWGGGVSRRTYPPPPCLLWGGGWGKRPPHSTCRLSPRSFSRGWSQPCHLADSADRLRVLQLRALRRSHPIHHPCSPFLQPSWSRFALLSQV